MTPVVLLCAMAFGAVSCVPVADEVSCRAARPHPLSEIHECRVIEMRLTAPTVAPFPIPRPETKDDG